MRKIYAMLAICLMAVSCVIEENDGPSHRERELKAIAHNLYGICCETSISMLQKAVEANDFLNASLEERKDPIYEGFGYYPSSETIRYNNYLDIETGGKSLDDPEAVWSISDHYTTHINISPAGENRWKIINVKDTQYSDYGLRLDKLDFTMYASLKDVNKYGLCSWACTIEGTYEADKKDHAEFYNSSTSIDIFWKTYSSGSSIRNELRGKGYFDVDFYADGRKTDYVKLDYVSESKTSRYGRY